MNHMEGSLEYQLLGAESSCCRHGVGTGDSTASSFHPPRIHTRVSSHLIRDNDKDGGHISM